MYGNESVDNKNAKVGTTAFRNGLSMPTAKKYKAIEA